MRRPPSRPCPASAVARAWLGAAAALALAPACDPVDDAQELRAAMDGDPWGDDAPESDLLRRIDGGAACVNSPTVYLNTGTSSCSGVMIAPDVMLTAGHCVRDGANMRDVAAMTVGTGAVLCLGSVHVDEVFVHPDFSNQRGPDGQQVRRPAAGDLAVVRLSAPVPGATIATLGTAIPGSASAQVTMTGFSRGTQHCANATVTATQSIQTGPSTSQPVHVIEGELGEDGTRATACVGDSGGPVYLRGTNVVVGINSQVGDVIPALPRVAGGPLVTTCTPPLYAPFDWDWVRSTLESGTGGVTAACTPGASEGCLGPGDTCDNAFMCGRITCGEDSRWGGCERTVNTVLDEAHADVCNGVDDDCDDTIDEDCDPNGGGDPCPAGSTRDPNTNLCACAGSCPLGSQMDTTTCQCSPLCGDGMCGWDETEWSCPIDCEGGGSSCICGWDCPPNDPACSGSCGDGMCDVLSEDSTSCPEDCEVGGSSCICGWDCPPNDPACSGVCGDGWCDVVSENGSTCPQDCNQGGGGDDDGGGYYDLCGDWDFWDWYVGEFGWDEAMDAYESTCAF